MSLTGDVWAGYGAEMRSLRTIVRDRAGALKLDLKDVAARLQIDDGNFRGILSGSRRVPIEDAQAWCAALELTGAEAEELIDAMHLAGATERVRAIVDRAELQSRAAAEMRERYLKRIATIRFVLDRIDAPDGDSEAVAQRAAADLNLADLVAFLEDLARTAGRSITIARTPPRPRPEDEPAGG